jgi:hypothetical protein
LYHWVNDLVIVEKKLKGIIFWIRKGGWTMSEKKQTRRVTSEYSFAKRDETQTHKDFVTAPIFAGEEQKEGRMVPLPDGTLLKSGGVPHPLYPEAGAKPALDVRHSEILFCLYSFFRQNLIDFDDSISITKNQLFKITGWTKDKDKSKLMNRLLYDLCTTMNHKVFDNGTKVVFTFLIPPSSYLLDKNDEILFMKEIRFNPEFIELMSDIENRLSVQLDVFQNISNPIAKAIYLYIPSRVIAGSYDSEAKSFKITSKKLFEQIAVKKEITYRSERKKYFTQNKNSIISQLDDAKINPTKKLKVAIQNSKTDKSDINLCFWAEELSPKDITKNYDSKLKNWYLLGGGDEAVYIEKVKVLPELNHYEMDCIDKAKINFKENEKFLCMAKAILSEGEFREICGEIKYRIQTDGYNSPSAIRSPLAYFISLVRRTLTGELPLEF